MTTTGYGDSTPYTPFGKFLITFAAVSGIDGRKVDHEGRDPALTLVPIMVHVEHSRSWERLGSRTWHRGRACHHYIVVTSRRYACSMRCRHNRCAGGLLLRLVWGSVLRPLVVGLDFGRALANLERIAGG